MKRVFSFIGVALALTLACQAVLPGAFVGKAFSGATGPNTYYNSQTQGSGSPATFYIGQGYYFWGVVTVAQGGTCTKLRAYQSAAGTDSVKFALYNGSGTLVGSSGAVAATGVGFCEATGLSISVSPGTYRVAFCVQTGGVVGWEQNAAGVDNDGGKDTETYNAGFPSTINTSNTPSGGMLTVGMYVQ